MRDTPIRISARETAANSAGSFSCPSLNRSSQSILILSPWKTLAGYHLHTSLARPKGPGSQALYDASDRRPAQAAVDSLVPVAHQDLALVLVTSEAHRRYHIPRAF